MGLIKSAIYAGAGMYAVNQVVKVSQNRQQNNNNPNNNSSRRNAPYDDSYNDDRAYHPRPMEFREPSSQSRNGSRAASRSPHPPQYNDATAGDLNDQKRIEAQSASQSQYQYDGYNDSVDYQNNVPQYAYADTPMQRSSREYYGQPSGRRQGYVEDGEVYDDGRPMQNGSQGGNGDLMAKLGPLAEQFMGGSSGGKGKGKGSVLSGLMGGR